MLIYKNQIRKKTISLEYCKSENFCEHFIFANIVKRHICNHKNLQLGHVLPLSVNDKSDFAILRGLYFHVTSHMRSFAKVKPSFKFPKVSTEEPI